MSKLIPNSKLAALLLLLFSLLFLSACETIGYYSQSVLGHSQMMLARQPLDEAILEAQGEHQALLLAVKPLRRFAVEQLGLPDNGSYLNYVDMEREYPVWSVVAAPEFSVDAVTWCYPIVGCASYRGYFSDQAAQDYAKKMQTKNFETSVGGVPAYSTLGWFADPLIPSMLRHGKVSFMQLMFHELAHQQLYVKGNSAFNEAFATVVGEQGTLLWLKLNEPEKVDFYQQKMTITGDFSFLLKETKEQLEKLYARSISPQEMRAQKQAIFVQMKQEYEKLKTQKWFGKAWYSRWFKKPVNNARLASFSTYRDLVPAFEALLKDCGNDFTKFYEVVALQKGKGQQAVVARECVL